MSIAGTRTGTSPLGSKNFGTIPISKGLLIDNPLALGVMYFSIHMKKPERWLILPV
jgi:hypothetical protein